MNVGKINKINRKSRILLAPLDWGLGHAARCIPIIGLLIKHGAEVIIAAEGPVAALIKGEFPDLLIISLKGYKVRYSTNRNRFFLKMLSQAPAIRAAIKYEQEWLQSAIKKHEIDAVISDNRFGLYTNKIPCVFITHQLQIQTGLPVLDKLAQKINYRYINKFNECWVPDRAGMNNLAGKLSHPQKMPAVTVRYLGILSRCRHLELPKEIDLLIMISGPEPQRSIFEKMLLSQLSDLAGKIVFLRGLPLVKEELIPENKNISIFNHLPSEALNKMIQQSKMVLARCGYSTIMDLAVSNQKAILIPTPGQTEQEYLATYLKEKRYFFTEKQEQFSLKKALEQVNKFEFSPISGSGEVDENIITEWLHSIKIGTANECSFEK